MHLSKQTKQLLTLLALVLFAYVYFHNEDAIKQSTPSNPTIEKPSAFIDGSEIRLYNEKGKAEFILASRTALFFDYKNSALIENPDLKLLHESDQYIYLRSLKGTYDTASEQLVLKGDVIIELPAQEPNKAPIQLTTSELHLDKRTRFISTEQAVTISQGQNNLRAIGLEAYLDDKKINLLSQVRGRYALGN